MKQRLVRFMISVIKSYQVYISPRHPGCCKYTPSCSAYAIKALEQYGPFRGSWMAFWRILRCNPFSMGGYDPVPSRAADTPHVKASAQQAEKPPSGAAPLPSDEIELNSERENDAIW